MFFSYQGIIRASLEKDRRYDLILMPDELEILNGFHELLEVFDIFTTAVQGNSYCTINLVPLLYTEIEERLNTVKLMTSNKHIKRAAEILCEKLGSRIELTQEIIAAACVDPVLQHLDIIDVWLSKKGKHFQLI